MVNGYGKSKIEREPRKNTCGPRPEVTTRTSWSATRTMELWMLMWKRTQSAIWEKKNKLQFLATRLKTSLHRLLSIYGATLNAENFIIDRLAEAIEQPHPNQLQWKLLKKDFAAVTEECIRHQKKYITEAQLEEANLTSYKKAIGNKASKCLEEESNKSTIKKARRQRNRTPAPGYPMPERDEWNWKKSCNRWSTTVEGILE